MPLYYAVKYKAGLEVVAAVLHAYPEAASKVDKVCCWADVGHCVLDESMCATIWFILVWVCVYATRAVSWFRSVLHKYAQT